MELKHIAARFGRLSSFLREEMQMSAGLMNRLKWKGQLFVNGSPVHTDYAVQIGDVITVPLDEPAPDYPAQQGDITVIYEDEHLLAVDKPAGMLIHPSRSRNTGTLANYVLGYYEQTGQCSAFHPLTRLDRDTFGIVLLAKNAHIHSLLMGQEGFEKTYHAWVFGSPQEDAGIIDAPIGRRPLPSLLRQVMETGKPSVTKYRVLERKEALCKLALQPVTGRTHQLRVHCAYMGFPILGDPQYGSAASMQFSSERGISTQLLCAKRLSFTHPITGQKMELESPMDA
ncbi:MAG: RluA family pseudouridine synthase [Oscillospiraceae bacterium]|nr:RluA family pseudouridine synthase [Oscillospiraceae bacterium]